MRSIEFLREYSPEAGPMTDAEYAAQQAQGQKNLAALKGVGQKIAGAFQGNNQAAAPIVPLVNPYQGADAAKFAAMTPADQAFYTQGGGKPDINDPYIAMRAPNKGKPPAPNLGAGALASTSSAEQSSAAAPAASPSLGAGALASTSSAEQSSSAATTSPVAPPTALNPSPVAPAAPNSAAADAERDGAPVAPAAPNSAAADAERDGAPVAAATAPPDSNPTDARLRAGTQTAPTGAAAPKAGSDPKIKALQDKLIAAGAKIKSDGIMGPATQAAMKQFFPNAAAGQVATPAPKVKPPRYKTPQEYDREIARFSKTSNPKLPPNARYIATLQAEKAALAGAAAPAGQAATPAPAAPLKPGLGSSPMRENTFAESVDLMRRLSTMLKG